MTRPNNFPREGMHEPVTQDELKRMQRERPVLNTELHYTIGGETETTVHSNLSAEREAAIANGAKRLHQMSRQVSNDFEVSKPDARTEYIRAQINAARGPARTKIRKHDPSR